jgi:hypothetical protein
MLEVGMITPPGLGTNLFWCLLLCTVIVLRFVGSQLQYEFLPSFFAYC